MSRSDDAGKTPVAAPPKAVERDKPDSKPDTLDSPISPLLPSRPSSLRANTSSSSSSSGSGSGSGGGNARQKSAPANRSHSGELSVSVGTGSGDRRASGSPRSSQPGHRRSGSGPVAYSSGGAVSSTASNVLPVGNICPSGKIGRSCPSKSISRSDVLGLGTSNYGHGNIVRNLSKSSVDANAISRAMGSSKVEEVVGLADKFVKKGQFEEALKLYDHAVTVWPKNMASRCGRAATFAAMGRFADATQEYEAALIQETGYYPAQRRLASLYLRLGLVEDAHRQLYYTREVPDQAETRKFREIEKHMRACAKAREFGDWNSLLRETTAAIGAGADASVQLLASRAEAFLHIYKLEEAENVLSTAVRLEPSVPSSSFSRYCGMPWNSYLYVVRAQIEMALGRFDSAESYADKARGFDPNNKEVELVLNNVKLATKARNRGNELFNSMKFVDACFAYGDGLRYDPLNSVLYCNRAACYSKLSEWKKSIDDCNKALKIQPTYSKALLRRATCLVELRRWHEAVQDYEALTKLLPQNNDIAKSLFHAQIALKTLRGEDVSNLTFGGEVEKIVSMKQFQDTISLPGVSVIYFMTEENPQCLVISPFVDTLCRKYPAISFHKVNTIVSEGITKSEKITTLPTFKFYKNGVNIKEMICPSPHVLESSVKDYAP